MKKILKISMMSLVTSAFLVGCMGSKPEKPSNKANEEEVVVYVDKELEGSPKWVLNPEVPGMIAEMGSAKRNTGSDLSFQRNEAMADSRDNLAKQVKLKVSNMFKSFKASTGSGDAATFDKSVESVSKQIADETLVGSVVKGTWISKTGTLYVLMAIDVNQLAKQTKDVVKTSFKNDDAMYQKFLAEKGQEELAKELAAK
jgi:hypothetical protein